MLTYVSVYVFGVVLVLYILMLVTDPHDLVAALDERILKYTCPYVYLALPM